MNRIYNPVLRMGQNMGYFPLSSINIGIVASYLVLDFIKVFTNLGQCSKTSVKRFGIVDKKAKIFPRKFQDIQKIA